MSRNSTWYTISRWSSSNVIDRDLLFYRTARTAKKARSIAANNPGAKILMERHTPSSFKWLHDIIPDNSKKMRQLRRLYRNFRRREADAKKRVARNQRKERVARWVAIKQSFDRAYGDVARASRKVQRKLWAFWNSLDTGTGGEKL